MINSLILTGESARAATNHSIVASRKAQANEGKERRPNGNTPSHFFVLANLKDPTNKGGKIPGKDLSLQRMEEESSIGVRLRVRTVQVLHFNGRMKFGRTTRLSFIADDVCHPLRPSVQATQFMK